MLEKPCAEDFYEQAHTGTGANFSLAGYNYYLLPQNFHFNGEKFYSKVLNIYSTLLNKKLPQGSKIFRQDNKNFLP